MLYYKKIPWENLEVIAEKTMAFLTDKRPEILTRKGNYSFWILKETSVFLSAVPEIQQSSAMYELVCNYAAIYSMHNNYNSGLHIDNYLHNARINLPILKCPGSLLMYWTGGIPVPYYSPASSINKTTHKITRTADTKKVDEVEVDAATVIRVNEIHSVFMPPNAPPRISLTLGFDKDPEFLLQE